MIPDTLEHKQQELLAKSRGAKRAKGLPRKNSSGRGPRSTKALIKKIVDNLSKLESPPHRTIAYLIYHLSLHEKIASTTYQEFFYSDKNDDESIENKTAAVFRIQEVPVPELQPL